MPNIILKNKRYIHHRKYKFKKEFEIKIYLKSRE